MDRDILVERPPYDSRPRRRFSWWWVLALTAVILSALILAQINAQATAAVTYLDGVRSSAEDLVTAAATFSSLPDDLVALDRVRFQTSTDSVITALERAAVSVDEGPQQGSLVGAASLFRLAVSTWTAGIVTFQDGMLRSADDNGAGEEQIYAGLQQVAAADQLYQGVLTELARADVPDPITAFPELRFHSEAYSPVALARLFSTAASASNSLLALRSDLAVSQVTARPEWVTDPDGDLVIGSVDVISIDVVVSNMGNVDAPTQNLFLNVAPTGGDQISLSLPVPVLAPGEQTTISFIDIAVVPGTQYQLSAAIQLTGPDGNATNDGIALAFFVNEPTT